MYSLSLLSSLPMELEVWEKSEIYNTMTINEWEKCAV